MENEFEIDYEKFKVKYITTSESTCELKKCIGIPEEFVIPEKVEFNGNSYTVTSIGSYALALEDYNKVFKSVVIPNTIECIKYNAFSGCTGLTKITLPESISEINDAVFNFCTSLREINIPKAVTSIGEEAFRCCYALKSIVIPDNVKFIGYHAFEECKSLNSVVLPESIPEMENGVFAGCKSLDLGVVLYDNGKKCYGYVGRRASVSEIIIPEGVEFIHAFAFDGVKLNKVVFPKSLKVIDGYAFANCSELRTVVLPDGLESIGKVAFRNCSNLESCYIPNSVTSMEEDVFDKCMSLQDLHLPENDSVVDIKFGKCAYSVKNKRLKELNKLLIKGLLNEMKKSPGCKYLKATVIGERYCEISLIYNEETRWSSVYKVNDLESKVDELKEAAAKNIE